MVLIRTMWIAILFVVSQIQLSSGKRYHLNIHDGATVCKVDDRFLSFALGTYHARQRFKAVDFTSQRLKNLINALRPAYLRFGGSDANFLVFRPGERLLQPTLITTQTTPATTPTTQTTPTTRPAAVKTQTTTEATTKKRTTTEEATTTTEAPTTTEASTTTKRTTTAEVNITTRPFPIQTAPPTQKPPITPPPEVPVTTPPQMQLPNVGGGSSPPSGGMPPWGAVGEGKLNDDKEDSKKDESKEDNKEYLKNGRYYAEDIKQNSYVQNAAENAAQYADYYNQYDTAHAAESSQSTAHETTNIQQQSYQTNPQNNGSSDSSSTVDSSKGAAEEASPGSPQSPQYGDDQNVPIALSQQAAEAEDSYEPQVSDNHQEENGNTAKRSINADKRSRQERFPFWFAAEDFDRLVHFTQETGLKLIFDLNGFFRRPDGGWDATNAIDIVRHVKDEGYEIIWELGNEPNRYSSYGRQRMLTAAQVAQDTIRLRSLLMRSQHYGTVVLGPGVSRPGVSDSERFLKDFLDGAAWAIDAVTWHQYYKGRTARLDDFMDPKTLDTFKTQIEKINKVVALSNSGKPVWLGETGSAWGGGIPGVSDVYAASFSFLDKLGLAALYCNQVVIRQSLIGGNYALLDDDFTPRPDYWAALLHKKLIGKKVFTASGGDERLRVYAHCTNAKAGYPGGALTLLVLNLWKKTTAKIELNGTLRKQKIDEYLMTSSNGKMSSKSVDLNGEEIHLSSGTYVPKLHPTETRAPLKLPPRSYAFYVIPFANSKRCF